MRLISIVLSLTALGFASGAIAQSPSIDRKIAQQQNAKGEYAEKARHVRVREQDDADCKAFRLDDQGPK